MLNGWGTTSPPQKSIALKHVLRPKKWQHRLHRRFRRRAKIREDLTFHGLGRTALSELGNRAAKEQTKREK